MVIKTSLVLFSVCILILCLVPQAVGEILFSANNGVELYEIDTSVPSRTWLANLGIGIRGLAIDSNRNILYPVNMANGNLYVYAHDATTFAPLDDGLLIQPGGWDHVWGAELLVDGTGQTRLFAVGRKVVEDVGWRPFLLEISLDAGGLPTGILTETQIVDYTDPENPIQALYNVGLACVPETGKLYSSDNFRMWEIDLDGAARLLENGHDFPTFGLAYEGGVVYGVTNDATKQLVTYDLATGDETTLASTAQVGWNTALCGTTTPEFPGGALPGDVDGNGVVDGLDLTAVLTAWETAPGDLLWDPDADLDDNNIVNGLDLTEVISNWTTGPGTPGAGTPLAAATSEPQVADKSGRDRGNAKRGSGNVKRKK